MTQAIVGIAIIGFLFGALVGAYLYVESERITAPEAVAVGVFGPLLAVVAIPLIALLGLYRLGKRAWFAIPRPAKAKLPRAKVRK